MLESDRGRQRKCTTNASSATQRHANPRTPTLGPSTRTRRPSGPVPPSSSQAMSDPGWYKLAADWAFRVNEGARAAMPLRNSRLNACSESAGCKLFCPRADVDKMGARCFARARLLTVSLSRAESDSEGGLASGFARPSSGSRVVCLPCWHNCGALVVVDCANRRSVVELWSYMYFRTGKQRQIYFCFEFELDSVSRRQTKSS